MLCLSSVIGFYLVSTGHNEKVYENYYHLHELALTTTDSEETSAIGRAILSLLATERKNVDFHMYTLIILLITGFFIMISGGCLWYWKIQRLDDTLKTLETATEARRLRESINDSASNSQA